MPKVFIGIGSNIDRERNIRRALERLDRAYGPLTVSRVYESAALGFDGDPFYNLVVAFDTNVPVAEISAYLTRIEDEHGRERRESGLHSRTLDLDLLLYGDRVMDEPGLKLPRPEIEQYAFVLRPLAEIAPNELHPITHESYAQMWRAFDVVGQETLPVDFDLGDTQ
jgi:2-amino-4-hydroxy-6-hydroxymethyldihydropteridine diphosphokinase